MKRRWEQVYLKYPEDREAAVFYALALDTTALPTDKTYANQKKAAEILNKIWKEQPNHPGVVHYLIHSDDSAQFAQAGLDAAICYAKIAPDVPHALHMPSHIFSRLGMWQESIDSNRAANAAALAYVRKTLGPESFVGSVHSMDYLEYAYLQTAQDGPARTVVDELATFQQIGEPDLTTAYAVAAIPARYTLERRDWPAATSLSPPAIGFPLERFPWAEAMITYARALGDARTGNIAGAEAEIANLQSLKEKLVAANNSYWANQVEVQRLAAAGILAHVQGDNTKAVELVRAAADLEATMDKHPVTPSAVLPARELLADLLLELDQPDAALKEYKEMLRTDPNRFRSILGEARAAKQSGDAAAAHDAYQKLVPVSKPVGSERPELAEAKAYLTN